MNLHSMQRGNRGFTLIEVMVAAAVIGIAATALFALLSRSMVNVRKVQDLHHYQLAGEAVMNRVLLLSVLPPGGTIDGPVKGLDAHWAVKVTPWIPAVLEGNPGEAVMKIEVEILWPGKSGQRNVKLEAVKAAKLAYSDYDFQKAVENAIPD